MKAKISQRLYFSKSLLNKRKGLVSRLPFKKAVVASLVINFLIISVVLILRKYLPPEVPLYFGLPEGEEQLAESSFLTLPSVFSLLILTVNSGIAFFFSNEFLKKVLVVSAISVTFLSLVTTMKIIFLIASF